MNRKDIYDDFKMKKPFGLYGLYEINSALYGLVWNSVLAFQGATNSVIQAPSKYGPNLTE